MKKLGQTEEWVRYSNIRRTQEKKTVLLSLLVHSIEWFMRISIDSDWDTLSNWLSKDLSYQPPASSFKLFETNM